MNIHDMPKIYANSNEVLYAVHYATLVSDKVTYDNNVGKFVLSYITPNIVSDSFDQTLPKNSTSNVINSKGNNLGVSRVTTSNNIEIIVPKYLFYITEIKITPNTTRSSEGCLGSCNPKATIVRKEFLKDQKFIIANVGGSVNTPIIIGVIE